MDCIVRQPSWVGHINIKRALQYFHKCICFIPHRTSPKKHPDLGFKQIIRESTVASRLCKWLDSKQVTETMKALHTGMWNRLCINVSFFQDYLEPTHGSVFCHLFFRNTINTKTYKLIAGLGAMVVVTPLYFVMKSKKKKEW